MTSWLCLPAFPLNPTAQDTLALMNLHFTVGMSGPNRLTKAGPEVTAKYEILMVHPVVARMAFEYRFGEANSKLYPAGDFHGGTLSLVALYYRGTRKMTGYIGAGVVYTFHGFQPTSRVSDSLRVNHGINKVSFEPAFGYRIILGLRFHHAFSLEIGVTEVKPELAFTERISSDKYAISTEKIRLSEVRVTVGYLLTLKRL